MKSILLMLCVITISACAPNYSNGERDGIITKLSEKGLIWKSWEGEMVQGGIKQKTTTHISSDGKYAGSTTSGVANVFEFNVAPEALADVRAAMESGEPVRLVYREWLLSPLTIENSHVVIAVKHPSVP